MARVRQFTCGQKSASVLGFGCGSVLGRVGRGDSLRAMQYAWDAGITLFETARSYGFGQAEAVLSEFLRGRRDQATVITKYGIPPQPPRSLKAYAMPIARAAARLVPSGVLRQRKQLRNGPARAGEFSAPGLRASVESSLSALQTDHIDVLLLHEATTDTLRQVDLMTELDLLIGQGKILRAGLYAGRAVVANAVAAGPSTVSVLEYGADLFEPPLADAAGVRGALLIGNHPFRSASHIARITSILEAMRHDQAVPSELRHKLRQLDWTLVLPAMLGVALTAAGFDALVFSMMRADHVRMNVRAIEESPFSTEELALLFNALQNSSTGHGAHANG